LADALIRRTGEMEIETKPTTVDEYIDTAPKEAQEKLREIRAILKEVAPNATETPKWGAPVFEEERLFVRLLRFASRT